ncbi:response regulator [Desulfopila sp. IMCC35006]|uniref:HD-GYP domain-containing protein n=1 Tax=Desulfopila sp. IMCC35006 TaxID=2569542 RepID=UPI0010AD8B7C|nr:HD domain-containing phosphohydrolase [Desulfopila sp. IMCC35006]TKB24252.1 response regulator [Desulfopila sp. IMCC35006]
MNEHRPLVLIVDDNATNIDLLVNTLKEEYRLGIAKRGASALEYAEKYMPNLILLDIMMPEMDGYEVCSRLKKNPLTNSIPLIFITAKSETIDKTKAFAMGAVDYITKPFHTAEVKARVKTHIALEEMKSQLVSQNAQLEKMVEKKTIEIQEMLHGSICSMALMAEIRDPYTAGHQQRVAQLACAIAAKMGLSDWLIEGIRIAGLLHDVGKIRIPVSILNRMGQLLDAELEVIKIHPQISFEILKNIPFPWPCAQMVFQHHERLDGSGYPLGLRGDEMLLESKILAVADVTEATSSFRPYRPAKGMEAALADLRKCRGITLDAEAVDACLEIFESGTFVFEYDLQKPSPILCVASPEMLHSTMPSHPNR